MSDATDNGIAPNAKRLLWAGFLAILAAGIGFGVRGGILANWGADFGFTGRDICKRTFDAGRARLRAEFAAVRADLLELDTESDCAEELARFFRHRLRRMADETGG